MFLRGNSGPGIRIRRVRRVIRARARAAGRKVYDVVNLEYDSPSKDHDDMDYFIIAKSQKNTKRDKKNGAEVEALLDAIKDKLKKNKITEAITMLEETKIKDSSDINYLKGVCYLVTGQYHAGILTFKSLLSSPKPKKDIYLMLSVCYKKI